MDKIWMHMANRFMSHKYSDKINKILTTTKTHALGSTTIRCPCQRCHNNLFLPTNKVENHLFTIGINRSYIHRIFYKEVESWVTNSLNDDEDIANE